MPFVTQPLLCVRHPPKGSLSRPRCCFFCPLEMQPVLRGCPAASAPSSVTLISLCDGAVTVRGQATPPASPCWFHGHLSSPLLHSLRCNCSVSADECFLPLRGTAFIQQHYKPQEWLPEGFPQACRVSLAARDLPTNSREPPVKTSWG